MARGSFLGLAFAAMLSIMTASAMGQAPSAAPAPAPITGPVYLISFFEIAAPAADKTAPLLTQYAAEGRKAEGNSGVLALRETARPGRFALVELWRDAHAHGHAEGQAAHDGECQSNLDHHRKCADHVDVAREQPRP